MEQLRWLPEIPDWRARLRYLATANDPWPLAVALANARIDFTRTNALADMISRRCPDGPPAGMGKKAVRLAVLGSATVAHLLPGIQVAALRRNIHLSTFQTDFGQYLQALLDADSTLHAFRPDTVLFAFDAHHLTRGVHAAMSMDDANAALTDLLAHVTQSWTKAQALFGCPVLQQTALNVFFPLVGSNEHRLPGSKSSFITRFNEALRPMADAHGVDLVALDDAARKNGVQIWHDPGLWHRAKQEVTPALSPTYGELVGRVLAAQQGCCAKCLVLDLDNTVWGGVVGDDGCDGIVLGQGSAMGEGFVAVQDYAKALASRGIILAVCSKNSGTLAREPFDRHPEMVLRLSDIASFHANWQDKAANICAIAKEINIGLDSMVFLDDNPFERNLVREALPMVIVPEVPNDDPSRIPGLLADAGYFESLGITAEDRTRTMLYQENLARDSLRVADTDLEGYLSALDMRLVWSHFDTLGQARVVQLINKTNQFNLTTRRYTAHDITAVMADPHAFGLQIRLVDRFGDNGIIAVVIGRIDESAGRASDTVTIDTWLMSCRVLGRGVERATLDIIVAQARALDASCLVGEYVPTEKNAMVRDHYISLGFRSVSGSADGRTAAVLQLQDFTPEPGLIHVSEGLKP